MKLFLPESVLPVSNSRGTLLHYEPWTFLSFFSPHLLRCGGRAQEQLKDNLPQTFTRDIGEAGKSPVIISINFLNLYF